MEQYVCIYCNYYIVTSLEEKGTNIPIPPLNVVYTINSDPPGMSEHL